MKPSEELAALYPFLYNHGDVAPGRVIEQARHSVAEKLREISSLRGATLAVLEPRLQACAAALAHAFARGGRLLVMGNGGSATDAHHVSAMFQQPEAVGDRALPALSLTSDVAVITALANDVGFEVVFSRQIAALGRPGDVVLALSTSGDSANLLRGIAEARKGAMLTVGVAGGEGGRMATSPDVDHFFVVASSSVHRIQEAQVSLLHRLYDLTQERLRS